MTKLNNEIRELTIGELDAVNGAMIGLLSDGGLGAVFQMMQTLKQMANGAGSPPPPKSDPGAQQFQQVLQQLGPGGQG